MDDMATLGQWTAAMLRSSTPLLLATLGETLTQRVGIINLGVEGQMLGGACAGFAVAAVTGNPLAGLAAGAGAGLLLSTVHAALCLGCGANQIGSGIAVWLLGLGLTSYFGRPFIGGKVTGLAPLGGASVADIPFVGTIMVQLTPAAPLALLLVALAALWLYRTRTGLNWRIVGESFETARAIGLAPRLVQLQGILAGGLLSGLAGAILSVDYTQTWANDMTKGRGFVAVGLVIVARWNPFFGAACRTDLRSKRSRNPAIAGRRTDPIALSDRQPALHRLFAQRHRRLDARGSDRRHALRTCIGFSVT
jgi:ABC-type uncharacterized transport system permease subunit